MEKGRWHLLGGMGEGKVSLLLVEIIGDDEDKGAHGGSLRGNSSESFSPLQEQKKKKIEGEPLREAEGEKRKQRGRSRERDNKGRREKSSKEKKKKGRQTRMMAL